MPWITYLNLPFVPTSNEKKLENNPYKSKTFIFRSLNFQMMDFTAEFHAFYFVEAYVGLSEDADSSFKAEAGN